jgi:FlaA1/EpsC-like NDP-sugar epimerase
MKPYTSHRLNWDKLPGRTPSFNRSEKYGPSFAGKRVLITGAAGSIGSALAEAVAVDHPEQLVLVDMSEQGIYDIERRFSEDRSTRRIVATLGNVCDTNLMSTVIQRHEPQIIFHAAAFKHVPLLERNPFAAIANNTLGTIALARLSAEHNCSRFIFVSTDKAADPLSIMGVSKRIAEMALLTAVLSGTNAQTKVFPVRLGNVLNSSGSVVPLFEDQIASGSVLTVTHPEAQRYFITAEEAVSALIEAASAPYSNGILIPQMNDPVRIGDLARYMFSVLRPESLSEPDIRYTGLRPGDKMNEVLLGRDEVWDEIWDEATAKPPRLRRVISATFSASVLQSAIDSLRDAVSERDLTQLISILSNLLPDYHPSDVLLGNQQTLHAGKSEVSQ